MADTLFTPDRGRIGFTGRIPNSDFVSMWDGGTPTPVQMPAGLPPFLASSHGVDSVGVYGEIDYGSGHSRRRRLRVSAPQIITVMWDLSQAQMDAVHGWYEDDLSGGTLPFAAEVANLGPGLRTISGQWVDPPVATPTITERWIVSGKILADAASVLTVPANPARFFNFVRRPPRGTVTIQGYAPLLDASALKNAPSGSIAISGHAPSAVDDSGRTIPVGTIVLTGYVPIVINPMFREMSTGSITVTGHVTGVSFNTGRAPGAGSVSIGGYSPAGAADYHRYWRIDQIISSGNSLEIQEIGLYNGPMRISTGITPTYSTGPSFFGGASSTTLTDGVYTDLNTRVFWGDSTTLTIDFDFGSAVFLDGIDEGSYDNTTRFMTACRIRYSDDGSAWTTRASLSGLTYPGNFSQSNKVNF